MKYFLLLTICSIAAFVMVLRMRPDVLPAGINIFQSQPVAAVTPTPAPVETKTANERPAGRRRRAVQPVVPSLTEIQPSELQLTPPQLAATPARRVPQATVIGETVAVYVTNSSTSRVVRMLNRGDLVQTELDVIDGSGNWSLIRLPDQRIAGYVRSEEIEARR